MSQLFGPKRAYLSVLFSMNVLMSSFQYPEILIHNDALVLYLNPTDISSLHESCFLYKSPWSPSTPWLAHRGTCSLSDLQECTVSPHSLLSNLYKTQIISYYLSTALIVRNLGTLWILFIKIKCPTSLLANSLGEDNVYCNYHTVCCM